VVKNLYGQSSGRALSSHLVHLEYGHVKQSMIWSYGGPAG